jgi:hypothetical protein
MNAKPHSDPALFEEQQRFAPGWIFFVFLITAPVVLMQAFGTYQQLVRRQPWGTHPASDQGLLWADLLVLVVCCGVAWLVSSICMTVRVTRQLLDVNFYPVRHKRIRLSDISTAFVRSFSPMLEYCGWGLRLSIKGNGWGYFLRGDQGVQLLLRDGTKMLVGSQDPARLLSALRQVQPSIAPDKPMFTQEAS